MTPETNTPAPWWLDPGFVAFDTETTGVDPASDRIVTAAMVNFANGEVTSEHEWLLKLDIPIPPASTQVHGITDEHSQAHGQQE
ncbi:MAG: exonuclease domain-containing protein, partial [Actinomycetota bacterium]|nr:exonuclease domain-containing protein [Actinomycetota bacterium]